MQRGRFSWEEADHHYHYQEQGAGGAGGDGRTNDNGRLDRQQTQINISTQSPSRPQQDPPPPSHSYSQSQSQSRNPRFSYTKTPAMMQGSTFDAFSLSSGGGNASRPHTYIDEDPMSPETTYDSTPPLPQLPHTIAPGAGGHSDHPRPALQPAPTPAHSTYPDEKKSPVPTSPGYEPPILPPQEVHPAHFAPYADQGAPVQATSPQSFADTRQQQQSPQYAHAQQQPLNVLATPTFSDPRTPPPMTYPPMPRSPVYQSTDSKPVTSPSDHKPAAPPSLDFYHPDQNIFANPAVPSSPRTPIYASSPHPFGPARASTFGVDASGNKSSSNLAPSKDAKASTNPHAHVDNNSHAAADHLPGQIAHPLASTSKQWQASLLAPSATCGVALCCPCVTYGRVQYRLAQRSRKAEATDLLGYSAVNGQCGLFAALCGLCGLLPAVQRARTRRAYGIEHGGGVVGDCLRGCACCCCTVALNETEIVKREEDRRKMAGPVTTQYASAPMMSYAA